MAGLILAVLKLNEPRENAAARAEEVEGADREPGKEVWVGDASPIFEPEATFGACRRSCSAFARAFSWVRTKYARFWRSGQRQQSPMEHLSKTFTDLYKSFPIL